MLRFNILTIIKDRKQRVIDFIRKVQCLFLNAYGYQISERSIQGIIYYRSGNNRPINYMVLQAIAIELNVSVDQLDTIPNPFNNAA